MLPIRLSWVGVLTALFSVVGIAAGGPATVRAISITGNSAFSEREILTWISSRLSVPYSNQIFQNDLRTIVERYRATGYLGATAMPGGSHYGPDSTTIDLSIRVLEGRLSIVGGLAFSGLREMSATEILSRFDTRVGSPLEHDLLEQDIEGLLRRYEKLGYPFVRCSVASIVSREGAEVDSLEITLSVEEGERMTIEEVRINGNRETDASVIVRETRLNVGEPYNPVKVNAIRQRLNRLNIFAAVSEPELYLRRGKGGLLIRVVEGNTNTFDGIVGYIPAVATGQSGYFTGLASVSMRNLFGTGRKLSVRWQKEDRHSQELGVRYVEPWVLGAPVNIGGGLSQRQQDTSYIRRVIDVKGELMFSEELSASILFGSESVIPSADSTARRVLRSVTTSVGVELHYDTRDDIYSPSTGARYQTDYLYGAKVTKDPPVNSSEVPPRAIVQRIGVDLDFYLPSFTRQVIAVGIHGRKVESGVLEESEMYRFGGTNTLRGYRENEFLGSRVAWSNTEYRFLLARRSFLYGFIDTGYFFRPPDAAKGISRVEGFRYGYGIGIRVDTLLGNLGVSFALGQGDSFGTAKVHFGLINEF